MIIALAGLALLAVAGAAYSRRSAPTVLGPALERVAGALSIDPPEPGSTVIEGVHRETAIRIDGALGSDDEPDHATIRVTMARPAGMSARSEGLLPSFDFKTGDPEFDRQVKLAGEPPRLAGVLSSEVRELLIDASRLRAFRLEGRRLSCQVPDLSQHPNRTAEAARLLVGLAETLRAQPKRTEALLLHNVRAERLVEVRRRCALFLGDAAFAGSDEQAALGETLLRDQDLDLRLDGADRQPDSAGARQVYLSALAAPTPEHRFRAVEGISGSGHPEAVAALKAILPEPDSEVAAAVASALGHLGGDGVERVLVRMLGRTEVTVKIAAAEALGDRGTIAAVERLLAVGGPRASKALQRAARQAVAAIQARAGVGEGGGLALVEGEDAAGRLSRAEGGELAVVEE